MEPCSDKRSYRRHQRAYLFTAHEDTGRRWISARSEDGPYQDWNPLAILILCLAAGRWSLGPRKGPYWQECLCFPGGQSNDVIYDRGFEPCCTFRILEELETKSISLSPLEWMKTEFPSPVDNMWSSSSKNSRCRKQEVSFPDWHCSVSVVTYREQWSNAIHDSVGGGKSEASCLDPPRLCPYMFLLLLILVFSCFPFTTTKF